MNGRELILSIGFAAVWLTAFSGLMLAPPQPKPAATLGVPLVAQHGHYWCWAASSEMCMEYYRDSIDANAPALTQCDAARQYYIWSWSNTTPPNDSMLRDTSYMDCAPDSIENSQFDIPAQPFFYPNNSACKIRYYNAPPLSMLDWTQLCDTFAAKRPVIFIWGAVQITDTNVSGNHCMVAEGCSETPGMPQYKWVSIIDPWPLEDTAGERIARHSQIAYTDYENTTLASVNWKKNFAWRYPVANYAVSRNK